MQFQLRSTISHPKASPNNVTSHVFSSCYPRLITASKDLLIDHTIATNATTSTLRTSSNVHKLAYIGGTAPPTLLAFLEDGNIAIYHDVSTGLEFIANYNISNSNNEEYAKRPVTFVHASLFGTFAIFVKSDSPSIWCLPLSSSPNLQQQQIQPFKLRSDIGGDQQNVSMIDGTVAKLRGKVTIKAKLKHSPVIAITSHPSLPFIAAAYLNGLIRIWDINKREQRLHLDIQLLLGESIVSILFHPLFPVLITCTTHGRLVSFTISTKTYKRGDEPALATSKIRDRKRKFQSMCFTHTNPPYLIALTASKRIIVRLINRRGMILPSYRFAKASKPLSTIKNAHNNNSNTVSTFVEKIEEFEQDKVYNKDKVSINAPTSVTSDPTFGLIACSLDNTGNIYLFEPYVETLPSLRIPISSGLDYPLISLPTTPSSSSSRNQNPISKLLGDVQVDTESLFVYNSTLFSYTLGTERISKLCKLPAGEVRSMDVARDQHGYCVAALIFYNGDDLTEPTEYIETQEVMRYVICTRRGPADYWNSSEPNEGRSGCFLGNPGSHDRIFIISASGYTISISSFDASSNQQQNATPKKRSIRGVQRFKISSGRINKAFRTPFANWSAVLYFDKRDHRIAISKNAFGSSIDMDNFSLKDVTLDYSMDDGTSLQLQDNDEIVLDVRWQLLSNNKVSDDYLGAVMTNKRIYFTRHILQPLSTFEFSTISKIIIPFGLPCISWAGPSIMLLYGNSLFTISTDASYDFIAGLSHGECATSIIGCLPDRLVYVSPLFSSSNKKGNVCVRSRLYGGISSVTNGMLSLTPQKKRQNNNNKEVIINNVFEKYDVSQSSIQLVNKLKMSGVYGLSYLMAVSKQGKFSLPPLKRAIFLSHMGDIRGALVIAENEYKKLQDNREFHGGTELYRLLQRILNMSFIIGDFHVCKRCSQVLGKSGTLSSFVEIEGGYSGLTALLQSINQVGIGSKNREEIMKNLNVLMTKSQNSSVASQLGIMPSRKDVQSLRQAIANANINNKSSFGSVDNTTTFIQVVTQQQTDQKQLAPPVVNRVQLQNNVPESIEQRLELFSDESNAFSIDAGGSHSDTHFESEHIEFVEDGPPRNVEDNTQPIPMITNGESSNQTANNNGIEDSSDDEGDDPFVGPGGKGGEGRAEIEGLLPEQKGQLSQATIAGISDTKSKIAQQHDESNKNVMEMKQNTTQMIQEQKQLSVAQGIYVSEERAKELLVGASEKIREKENMKSAQKDIENAIKLLSKSVEKGMNIPQKLLINLVHYKYLCKLRIAMNEIIQSENHSMSVPGRITYVQFATACTNLSVFDLDKIDCLVKAVDGHLSINNFGMASQGLKVIKTIGVPEGLRDGLRKRYSVCQSRAYMDAVPIPTKFICYSTLRAFLPGTPMFSCSVCTAIYSIESGVQMTQLCQYCQVGRIVMR